MFFSLLNLNLGLILDLFFVLRLPYREKSIHGPGLIGRLGLGCYGAKSLHNNLQLVLRREGGLELLQGVYGGGEQLIAAPALQAAQLPQAEVHLEEGEEGEVGVAVPAQETRPVLLVSLLLSGIRTHIGQRERKYGTFF